MTHVINPVLNYGALIYGFRSFGGYLSTGFGCSCFFFLFHVERELVFLCLV
jgi:hypothetical protein